MHKLANGVNDIQETFRVAVTYLAQAIRYSPCVCCLLRQTYVCWKLSNALVIYFDFETGGGNEQNIKTWIFNSIDSYVLEASKD